MGSLTRGSQRPWRNPLSGSKRALLIKSGRGLEELRSPSGIRFQGAPPAAGGGGPVPLGVGLSPTPRFSPLPSPSPTHTFAHSRARCFVRLALRSSAYRAPMKEPMDVPPTRSTGTPASSNAFSTPMCEQPLERGANPGIHWGSPRPPPNQELPSPISPGNQQMPASPLRGISPTPRHQNPTLQGKPHPSPGPAPAQHQGNGVACEHPRQAGKVAVPVCAPRENLLIELVLGCGEEGGRGWGGREATHEDGGAGGGISAFRAPLLPGRSLGPAPCPPSASPSPSAASPPHQLGRAAAREQAAWTAQMQVPRTPAPHVEPLDRARGARALLPVKQHQLLESTHRRVLQHLLQLWASEGEGAGVVVAEVTDHGSFPPCPPYPAELAPPPPRSPSPTERVRSARRRHGKVGSLCALSGPGREWAPGHPGPR